MKSYRMPISKAAVCMALLACAAGAGAQASSPTSYMVIQSLGAPGTQTTFYRSGSKVLMVMFLPAQGAMAASKTYNLYDLAAGKNWSWNPDVKPIQCSAGTFSGDWGDPFANTAEFLDDVSKGQFKPAGTATINGFATEVYTGSDSGANYKIWFDRKDNLVVHMEAGMAGSPMSPMANVTKLSLAPPPMSLFNLPPSCAGVKAPPTPQEIIADETGDDPANFVSAYNGPGSAKTCSVVMRVVDAKTMAPIPRIQVAIDTTYKQENPPHYVMGVGDNGTTSYSGGGVHEITNTVRNGVVNLNNLPSYFMMAVNVIETGHSGGFGLFYRQCFAPKQVLLFLVRDRGTSAESFDALWVKSGKYAAPPTL